MSEDELRMLLGDIVHLERARKLPVCALESYGIARFSGELAASEKILREFDS